MGIFNKLIKGNNPETRRSRFHDEKGNRATTRRIIINGSKALFSALYLKALNKRPDLPWISYDAIKELKKFFNQNMLALEFGSGMSTLWYAKNVKKIYSVENYKDWYDKISEAIKIQGINNIQYEFCEGDDFSSYMSKSGIKFDFIMIDGLDREKCVVHAIDLIKPGGIIYLDNSDKDFDPRFAKDKTREAEEILLNFAKKTNSQVTYYSDFAPTAFFVQQGMMVKVNSLNI